METKVDTPIKQRVQFDFTLDALKRLEDLKEHVGASTKAEVIRNALKLYEWLATQVSPDDTIEVKNSAGKTLYIIPAKVFLP